MAQYLHMYNPEGGSPSKKYKPILRSSYTSIGVPYIEIQFSDRAIPVAQASLGANSSLTQHKNGATLKLETKDEAAFADLYNYLTKGRYVPSRDVGNTNLLTRPPVVEVLPSGLPVLVDPGDMIIQAIIPSNATPILQDVRAYRVGTTLEIPELQRHALQRLWNWGVTAENPVHVLEYLYHGTPHVKDGKGDKKDGNKESEKEKKGGGLAPPDELLRNWCREWLKTKERPRGGPNNLEIVRDPMRWGAEFRALRERGGLLIADVDSAEAEARAEEMEASRTEMREPDDAAGPLARSRGRKVGGVRNIGRIGWVQAGQEERGEWESGTGGCVRRATDNYVRMGR